MFRFLVLVIKLSPQLQKLCSLELEIKQAGNLLGRYEGQYNFGTPARARPPQGGCLTAHHFTGVRTHHPGGEAGFSWSSRTKIGIFDFLAPELHTGHVKCKDPKVDMGQGCWND